METNEKELETKVNRTNPDLNEGKVATKLEQQTAKIPSDVYLWASVGSMIASFVLKLLKKEHEALFIGQWAPSFLILGLYNKLVKQQGHD
ncbi:MAG: hypothetical protein ACNS62_15540 [Candidatus Cyclobacteriaceae bacterium M3_2C_046]